MNRGFDWVHYRMKKGFLIFWILLAALTSTAQRRFGNEWINPNQNYLKISVNQVGIYRISYQDIKTADASFLRTNPAGWQLFFRGREMAIRVVGQQDGVFDPQDYLEFYGEGNDGSQDSLLYRPQKRLHPYQTLFSEVAAYFLTPNSSPVGKRIPEPTTSGEGLPAEKYHVQETVQAFTSEYTFNNLKGIEPFLQQSYFEPGEGWSGRLLTADSVGIVPLKLTNRMTADWPIRLEGMVNGRDNLFHTVQIQVDNKAKTPVASLNFSGFDSQTFQATINPELLQNEQLTLRFQPEKNGTNQFSITYVKLSYPQAFDMAGQVSRLFHLLPNPRQTSLLAITNVPVGSFTYDISDKANARYLATQIRDGQTQVVVSETARSRDILVTNQTLNPLAIQPVRFRAVFPTLTDYLIITHTSLRPSATAYANYRASGPGGGYTPLLVEADSLYDQFNYGERSPLALRRFADFMLASTSVKSLLLLGKATSYPYFIKTATDDLVPTIGYPGSDILLTAGLLNFPANTPAIPTGRLNATTNDQVMGYLAKVKQLELTTPNGLWRKNIIHISGGKSEGEAGSLRTTLGTLGALHTNGQLGGVVTSLSKTNPYGQIESINIAPQVNKGVGLITFFGHAGPAITDMNFGFASLPQNGFRNAFYPFMIFNGCGVGEIFSRFNTLSSDWVLAPEKGAAVVLAHSYFSYEQPTTRYMTKLYSDLFTNPATLGMAFGKVQQQLNGALEKEGSSPYDVSVLLQMILQGDPVISLYPLSNPDFSVEPNGIYLQSTVAGSSLKNTDSVRVVVPLANLGKFVAGQSVSVSLTKTTGTGVTRLLARVNAFRYRDTLTYTLPKDERLQRIDVTIDPDQQLTELSRANNTATLLIDWTQANTGSSYPINARPDGVAPALSVLINGIVQENQAVVGQNPRVAVYLIDENPLSPGDLNAVELFLAGCASCTPEKVSSSNFTVTPVSANQLQVTTTLALTPGGRYQLIVLGKDAAGNRTQPPYVLNLSVPATDGAITLRTYPNPATAYTKFELDLPVQALPTAARLAIYSASGLPVFDDAFPVQTGKNTLVWPGKVPGVYVYSLRLIWPDGRTETRTGKVIQTN